MGNCQSRPPNVAVTATSTPSPTPTYSITQDGDGSRPTIAKAKGRKAPTRHIDPLQLLPQRGVCAIDWPTGIREARTLSLLQLLPEISSGPRLLHLADGGGSEAVRRYEGSPERQAAGNGGILTPFVLPSGTDSALSQLPPRNYTAIRRSARDDDDCVYRGGIGARVEILAFDHHETIRSV